MSLVIPFILSIWCILALCDSLFNIDINGVSKWAVILGGRKGEERWRGKGEEYGRNGFIGPSQERATYYYRTAHRIAIKCFGHASNAIQIVVAGWLYKLYDVGK